MSDGRSDRPVVCHISTGHEYNSVRPFSKECRALARAGFEVHYVACCDRDHVLDAVHIEAIPYPPSPLHRKLIWPWLAYRKVLSIRPRPVICHYHDPELMVVGMALRLRGFKVIYDVHENWSDQARDRAPVPDFLRPLAAFLYHGIERVLISGMPTVHVLESIAGRYRQPRTVVRNLPEIGLSLPSMPARPGRKRVRLVYAGGVARERGAITMIRLVEELVRRGADVELRIIGPVAPRDLVVEMEQTIAAAGLADRVMFNNRRIPLEEATAEIAAADIGLCILEPLRNYLNSLPTKVFEYMRFGLPVIASDFECWREYVAGSGSGVMVDPADLRGIADAAQSIIQDPKLRAEMSRRGMQAVREEYCWEKEQERLVAFYRRLLGMQGSPRLDARAASPAAK